MQHPSLRGRTFLLALSPLLLLASGPAGLANGFRNPPEGAAAYGRTGGKIAHIDDASAVIHNPANLPALEAPRVTVGSMFIDSETDFTGPLGRTGTTRQDASWIPYAFAAAPLDETFSVGIGLTAPYGQSTEWNPETPFGGAAPYKAELETIQVNPVFAWQLHDRVSVAIGFAVLYADLSLDQAVDPLRIHAEGDGYGAGGNAAITVEPIDRHRLAFTYRSAIDVELEGNTSLQPAPFPLSSGSRFDSEMGFPAVAAIGYGIELTDSVRVEFDAEWIEFSQFEQLPLNFGRNTRFLGFPGALPQQWEDTWTYGVGADWAFAEAWTLRAGAVYLESPIPDDTFSPTLPDDDRTMVTTGLGYDNGSHALDIAYGYSTYDRTIRGNTQPAFDGTYDNESHLVSASYRYTF